MHTQVRSLESNEPRINGMSERRAKRQWQSRAARLRLAEERCMKRVEIEKSTTTCFSATRNVNLLYMLSSI